MALLPPVLEELVVLLSRLPGIGERTATRLAFATLAHGDDYARSLSVALDGVRERITYCEACHMVAESPRCAICPDDGCRRR